jgi:hypothetical protein
MEQHSFPNRFLPAIIFDGSRHLDCALFEAAGKSPSDLAGDATLYLGMIQPV